jgi:multidrug/hemolysin transport system ATP-binding protein
MVCVIDAGRLVAQDTPANLRARYATSHLTLTVSDPAAAQRQLGRDLPWLDLSGGLADGSRRLGVATTNQALQVLASAWDWLEDFEFRHGSMDDVFLSLTGHTGVAEASPHAAGPGRWGRAEP